MEVGQLSESLARIVFRLRGGAYLVAGPLLALASPVLGTRAWVAALGIAVAWMFGRLLQRGLCSPAMVLGSDLGLSVLLWWLFGPVSGAAFISYAVVSVAPIVLPHSRRLLVAAVATVAVEVGLHVTAKSQGLPLFHPHEPIPGVAFGTGMAIQAVLLVAVGILMERIAASLRAGERALEADLERERELHRLKDGFVATVSHELRTPLTALKGFTRTLLEDDPGHEVRVEYLEIMADQAEELHALVEDLITFGRIEAGQLAITRQDVDVVARVRTVVDGLGPRASTVTIVAPACLEADVDPVRWSQIVRNLIDNALKYGEAPYTVTVAGDGAGLLLSVEDRGDGIPQESEHAIFEPYERLVDNATMSRPGIGLGLPIVRQLVEAHGGTITLARPPEGGSAFEVRIPTASELPALTLS
jgi:signal transduction histidine kinase